MKKIGKTIGILMMALVVFEVMPMNVFAENKESIEGQSCAILPDQAFGDSEELFAGYVERQMYEERGIATYSGNYGEEVFKDELNSKVYQVLKAKIEKIAANGGYTTIEIPLQGNEIVMKPVNVNDVDNEVKDVFLQKIQTRLIMDTLLADCPYEMYWFDKTVGMTSSWSAKWNSTGTAIYFDKFIFSFAVSRDYRAAGYSATNPEVTNKVSSVTTAITNAKAVVNANRLKTDAEKLVAYKNYICDNVEYDYEALEANTPYGDPWQIIHVFDNDPSTKVVCEGYAKAFQYLCELSSFTDPGFACYSVTGTVTEPGNSGPHMWNIVYWQNKNSHVDITWVDGGNTAQQMGLFMNSQPFSGDAKGYVFKISGRDISYVYSEDTIYLYRESILKLGVVCPEGHKGGTATCCERAICTECERPYGDFAAHNITVYERKEATHNAEGYVKHWRCTVCQKYFADAAGVIVTTKAKVTLAKIPHKYGTNWVYNSDGHWHQCSCGSKKEIKIHTYASACSTKCIVCGYERVAPHQWNDSLKADGSGHILTCKLCKSVKEGASHASGQWHRNAKGWWYSYSDGCYLVDGVETIDGATYWFDRSGYIYLGWVQYSGTWYYMDSVSGAMQTGWVCDGGTWYYMDSNGAMMLGWIYDGGSWYCTDSSGAMITGWALDGDTWYYMNSSGAMVTGWVSDGGSWYYMDPVSGYMHANCWVGNYYMKADGRMAVNERVDHNRYYVDHNGLWVPGL